MTRTEPRFTKFIGIDWSGAKGPRLPGIQIAVCGTGQSAPVLIENPKAKTWTRLGVLDWLIRKVRSEPNTLIGMDFAFTYAWCDEGSYFPGLTAGPDDDFELWAEIDRCCEEGADLYAGPIMARRDMDYWRYFNTPYGRGDRFQSRRRVVEDVCRDITAPTSAFNGVGPGGVGVGSLAGMRFLHRLNTEHSDLLSIWPHQAVAPDRAVLVEAFPRFFFKRLGLDPNCWKQQDGFAEFLRHYDTEPPSGLPQTEDEADAIAISVALRALSGNPAVWSPEAMTPEIARHEGWIFGVGCAS